MTLFAIVPAVAAAADFEVDLSSQQADIETWPVATRGAPLCREREDTTLAVAIVIYGRRPGRSAWGHTSLRFIYCEGGQLRDDEYEYYRFSRNTEERIAERYPGRFDADYLSDQRGALYLYRNPWTTDRGFYAVELRKNRDIYEFWVELSEAERDALHASFRERHDRQLSLMDEREALDAGRYRPLGRNCTLPAREAIAALDGHPGELAPGIFPFRHYRDLVDRPGIFRVQHPGVRKAGEGSDIPVIVRHLLEGEQIAKPAGGGRGLDESS